MKRKFILKISVLFLLSVAIGLNADEPVKRVMNFIAVMDLRCGAGIDKDSCVALTEMLINEMVKMKKYTVIDRANRDKILSEAGYQQTGCVDTSCTIEMGRQLGVGKIIIGSITKIGKTYVVNLQLINVETAAIETSASETCEGCEVDKLIGSITNAAHKLMGEEVAPPPSAVTYTISLRLLNVQTRLQEKNAVADCGSDPDSMTNAVIKATRQLMEGVTVGARGKSIEEKRNENNTVVASTNADDKPTDTPLWTEMSRDPKPQQTSNKILVFDLQCEQGINNELCGQMTKVMINEIINLKFEVIDRANMEEFAARLGDPKCRSQECLKEMQMLLKAGKIVMGSIAKK